MCKVPFLDYLNVPRVKILQSCNGLLLCSSAFGYFICNSTTKQFKQIPFPNHEFSNTAFNLSLAFDPMKSNHYNVIAFRELKCTERLVNGVKPCQIYMYSSETDSWTPTDTTFTPPAGIGLHAVVFCNGKIHWDSQDVNSLYFDVDRECLNTMSMPESSQGRYYWNIRYFGESRGHLHLVVKDGDSALESLEFNVLEMATDYSGWFVRYRVNLYTLRIAFPKLFWHGEDEYGNVFSVLCVIRAKNEEQSMVVISLNGIAISYNFNDGTSEELCVLESKNKVDVAGLVYRGYHAYQYFETLCCV